MEQNTKHDNFQVLESHEIHENKHCKNTRWKICHKLIDESCFLKQKFVNFGLCGEVHENYTTKMGGGGGMNIL